MKTAFLFVILANPGWADCAANGTPLVACEIENSTKWLETCLVGDIVTYTFGPKGIPELSMSRHVGDVDFVPWPGIGRWIWEEFRLTNGAYSYAVHYSFERNPNNMEVGGGVTVWQGGTVLASLDCNPATLNFSGFPSPVYDAKIDAGQAWDFDAKRWVQSE
jgi:hypothetical protein